MVREGRFIVQLSSAPCWRDRRQNGGEHAEGGRGDQLLVLFAVLARVRGAELDGRFGAFLLVLVLLRLLLFSVAAQLTLRHGDLSRPVIR
jgi:hypothetical protein